MSEIRAVIFDCYTTLIDIKTNERKEEAFGYLSLYLQYYGASISAEGLRNALDLEKQRYLRAKDERYPEVDLEIVFRNVLENEGLGNPFLAGSCCKLFRLLSRERFELFPDSLPVLSELRKSGYSLAIVSDAQKVFCLEEGNMLGLNQFFDCIVMSTQFGFTKPDPRLFAVANTLLGVTPQQSVYVGNDMEKDVKGAKQAGMRAILLDRDGKESKKATEVEPDFYAKDLWEAWQWIRSNEA
jgi:putative hydrolase of the HAD superfamily